MSSVWWTINDASKEWGTSVSWTRKIVERIPGVRREVRDGKYIWLIPAGSPKPENKPSGRPFGKK